MQECNRPVRAQEAARGGVGIRCASPKLLRDARGRPGHGGAAPGPSRRARAGRGGRRRRGVLHGQGRRRERAALPPRPDHAHARRPGARAAAPRSGAGCCGALRASHRGQGLGWRGRPRGPVWCLVRYTQGARAARGGAARGARGPKGAAGRGGGLWMCARVCEGTCQSWVDASFLFFKCCTLFQHPITPRPSAVSDARCTHLLVVHDVV